MNNKNYNSFFDKSNFHQLLENDITEVCGGKKRDLVSSFWYGVGYWANEYAYNYGKAATRPYFAAWW